MFMSREGRKLIDYINTVKINRGIILDVTPLDMMCADIIVVEYFANIVLNTLKTKFKATQNTKQYSMGYWYPVIKSMYKQNKSAQKDVQLNITKDIQLMAMSYSILSEFVIVDYGLDDALMLCNIINEFQYSEIEHAIKLAKQQRVYEIRYLSAILQKEQAKKQLELKSSMRIDEIAKSSDRLLDEHIHTRTVMDMAQIEYNWKKTKENADLEKMMRNIISRGEV